MSMDRINADIEGGKGIKGMKWRSPATREFSRLKRSMRSPRRSKCPKGSRKDTRKHNRNPSGCRHSSPGRSGYRKYTRRSGGKKEGAVSTGRVVMGHTIMKLTSKSNGKQAGSLFYEHNGDRHYFNTWNKDMKAMWKA